MGDRFDEQLVTLNNELIEMGSRIEKAMEHTVRELVTQDINLANSVIETDEDIDRQERTMESLCLKLLPQQQPVAKDLRQISSALKMITDSIYMKSCGKKNYFYPQFFKKVQKKLKKGVDKCQME